MKRIAYIRVSTCEQRPDRQIHGLEGICDEVYIETLSAASKQRPIYSEVMQRLKPGDVFVIWDLDRAYRSTRDALTELEQLSERDIAIHIANLNIDTTTPHGLLIYTIISALAEFERRLLSQRTKEGLEAARRRGKKIGRPKALTRQQVMRAARRIARTGESFEAVGKRYGVAGWTLSRSIRTDEAAFQLIGSKKE